ncbi:MAG: HTTM domain-containing protein [Pirellulaceae bacterium]|nr:HTTM domain-containing protein [Pirellulaceae bacterium]
MTSQAPVIGLAPLLPAPLAASRWWAEPIRAERLAALRIGIGTTLLVDILWLYLPRAADFFGTGSLGSPEVFAGRLDVGWRWSLLAGIGEPTWLLAMLVLWAIAALGLMLGVYPRICAVIAWALAISVQNTNFYLHNSGDNVRQIALFYLMLSPCGAAWSLTAWWRGRQQPSKQPAFVHPWPVRLLTLQLVAIYFVNGLYKLSGGDWRSGEVMHDVLANVGWTRFAYADLPLIPGSVALMTWTTLVWELGFPLLMLMPKLRAPTLWLGVLFHLSTAILLPLGLFPIYMLCLYLPLVPWERFERCSRRIDSQAMS